MGLILKGFEGVDESFRSVAWRGTGSLDVDSEVIVCGFRNKLLLAYGIKIDQRV